MIILRFLSDIENRALRSGTWNGALNIGERGLVSFMAQLIFRVDSEDGKGSK